MVEFFRFRSTDALLDKYQELENRTIYFASPEELNDPMEGFRDIVWRGDKIVWTNFFRHYVFCLHRSFFIRIIGDSEALDADSIPILECWDKPRFPKEQDLFNDIWNRFRDLPNIQEILDALANTKHKIRYREIICYFQLQNFVILDEIQKSYIDHGLLSKSETLQPSDGLSVAELMKKLLDIIKLIEMVESEQKVRDLFQVFGEMHDNIVFTAQYNTHKISTRTSGNNNLLTMFDFPRVYMEQLEKLLWPRWYTACFTKSYHNSSVWAKYADDHKGVCLIFEAVKTDNSHIGLKVEPKKYSFL